MFHVLRKKPHDRPNMDFFSHIQLISGALFLHFFTKFGSPAILLGFCGGFPQEFFSRFKTMQENLDPKARKVLAMMRAKSLVWGSQKENFQRMRCASFRFLRDGVCLTQKKYMEKNGGG